MAETIKEKLEDVGHKIADTASKVGHRVGEGVEKAADWAKEKAHEAGHRIEEAAQKAGHKVEEMKESYQGGQSQAGSSPLASGIREHMDVYASCGTKVGTVDHVEGSTIKLTKSGSPDGQHHRIPLSWVTSVGDGVRLDRDHIKVQGEWQSA